MNRHCIGTVAEVYDANPPFRGHGAQSLSINQAEIIRALTMATEAEQGVKFS